MSVVLPWTADRGVKNVNRKLLVVFWNNFLGRWFCVVLLLVKLKQRETAENRTEKLPDFEFLRFHFETISWDFHAQMSKSYGGSLPMIQSDHIRVVVPNLQGYDQNLNTGWESYSNCVNLADRLYLDVISWFLSRSLLLLRIYSI